MCGPQVAPSLEDPYQHVTSFLNRTLFDGIEFCTSSDITGILRLVTMWLAASSLINTTWSIHLHANVPFVHVIKPSEGAHTPLTFSQHETNAVNKLRVAQSLNARAYLCCNSVGVADGWYTPWTICRPYMSAVSFCTVLFFFTHCHHARVWWPWVCLANFGCKGNYEVHLLFTEPLDFIALYTLKAFISIL